MYSCNVVSSQPHISISHVDRPLMPQPLNTPRHVLPRQRQLPASFGSAEVQAAAAATDAATAAVEHDDGDDEIVIISEHEHMDAQHQSRVRAE
jgi:formaldehyde-activating enzyme involved in methanogenesis